MSDPISSLDSLSLTVSTPGQNCSFTVKSLDGGADSTECRRGKGGKELQSNKIGRQKRGAEKVEVVTLANYLGNNHLGDDDGGSKHGGGVFTCVLHHLEPGTAYELHIQSHSDEEAANLTLHTRKS